MYIQAGAVRLSVLSHSGKEAIVAMLGPGDFLGEGGLASQRVRMGTATAVAPRRILVVPTNEMVRLLREEPGFSDRFIKFMLYRNIRIEEDLRGSALQSQRKAAGAHAAPVGALWQGRQAAGRVAQALAGDDAEPDPSVSAWFAGPGWLRGPHHTSHAAVNGSLFVLAASTGPAAADDACGAS